ncbi:MAG: restriction endonuclease [Acidobacteriota bacterium]
MRGATQEEAELRAKLQVAAWNERWEWRQSALKAKQERFERLWGIEANKQAAQDRTAELEEERKEIETVLTSGLKRPSFQWSSLNDNSRFDRPFPKEPVKPHAPAKQKYPDEPSQPAHPQEPSPIDFVPQLSLVDHLWRRSRRKKLDLANARLQEARVEWAAVANQIEREYSEKKAQWTALCSKIDAEFQRAVADFEATYERALLKFRTEVAAWESAKELHKQNQAAQHERIDSLRRDYVAAKAGAVEYFFAEVLNESGYPESFPQGNILAFDEGSGVLIVDFELPNLSAFPTIKEVKYVAARGDFHSVPVSDSWLKKTYDDVLYQIALRTLHELFAADEAAVLKGIVFNGWVRSIDRATGVETRGCILSVEATREEFLQINLSQVDPRACFRRLKGIASSKLVELTPVRPILTINKEDTRFVEGYAVANSIDDRTNLAAMDWLDFENLIRELFEKEFSKNGGEVKITQASRDGGVDAIAFDPDPIRGGKIVIQAKRYTNVVGVAAVRDLFGTVHNEGATKGILVTTSTYGPDAYEFAKDKPLTLLSGGELLSLLAAHGHRAKIDLQAAKTLNLQREQEITTRP